jgi:hypothetical protein
MPEKKYDVYISYARKDEAWVKQFASALKEAGANVWSDQELEPGERWQESLEAALRESNTLVVVLSPESVESRWTYAELGAAVAGGKKIIPVINQEVDLARAPMLLRKYTALREPSPEKAGKRVAQVIQASHNQVA